MLPVVFYRIKRHLTFFLLERGVRQGCPLFGLLLVIGILLLSIVLYKRILPLEVSGGPGRKKNYAVCRRHHGTGARARFCFAVTEIAYVTLFARVYKTI